MQITDYNYALPEELIAQEPATPRDSSRLFVYNTKTDEITIDRFLYLDRYLPQNSFLVLNTTKVVPSRMYLYKENGGKVKTLLLVNDIRENTIKAMVDRNVEVGQRLYIDQNKCMTVLKNYGTIFELRFDFSKEELFSILERQGSMPIPPYLKKSSLKEHELRKKYQTVFAKETGSAAAPTASLHFTPRVFNKLERRGIEKTFIQLHVGTGTFAPITGENLKEKKLHREWFEIPAKSAENITTWKNQGKQLVAVGTTVTRALESTMSRYNTMKATTEETEMFMYPPYRFKAVDILLTNFHVPQSSLMMLVDAFLQHKQANRRILSLYHEAIAEKMRFFSFGDAMLIV